MTPKQVTRRLETLLRKQAELRDQMRELSAEVEDNIQNADEACEALEVAADAVSRLV